MDKHDTIKDLRAPRCTTFRGMSAVKPGEFKPAALAVNELTPGPKSNFAIPLVVVRKKPSIPPIPREE